MKNPDNFNSDCTSFKVDFNENQKTAIKHFTGPALVLAGPGSGKTAVICGRLEQLITRRGIPGKSILVVTFSKKAALEMKERFDILMPSLSERPVFSTFHSIFYSVIKEEGGASLKVISERQKYNALKAAAMSLNINNESNETFFASLAGEISCVKGGLLDINGYAPQSLPADLFRIVYREYNLYLAENSLIDFDDMELKCCRLLSGNPAALKKWQDRFPFIMIDEFQDINLIQYEIIRLFAGKDKNVFAVGDDDQSIYGFRGSRPGLMKRFLKDFKDARLISLDINYRSCTEIISASGRVIKENEERFQKKIRPRDGQKSHGEVSVINFDDIKEEAEGIIDRIGDLQKNGMSLEDIAILYRNNADAEYMSVRLKEAGFMISGKLKGTSLYSHFISRDITAYLNAAAVLPFCSLSDILLIMNRPSRYISRRALYPGEAPFESMRRFYTGNQRMLTIITKFEDDLKMIKSLPPFAAVKYIRNATGYDGFIKEWAKENPADTEKYFDVLNRLEKEAGNFKSVSLWLSYINSEAEKEAGVPKNVRFKDLKGISIMTIHAAKGLEWEAVFIPTCIDAVIPGKNTDTQSALEEERRILYVAMTRAKSYLQISTVNTYKGKEAKPSRFLDVL